MPVAGYNVVPDENDHENVIGVEIEKANEVFNGKACVYIGEGWEQTEVHLDWHELKAHIWECNRVLKEMEWTMATYAFASLGIVGDTQHLILKGESQLVKTAFAIDPTSLKFEQTLCGRPAPMWAHSTDPRGWDIDPVLSDDPRTDRICKNCYRKWQKLQEQEKVTA
jgi:hypothetical protein